MKIKKSFFLFVFLLGGLLDLSSQNFSPEISFGVLYSDAKSRDPRIEEG